MKEYGGYNLILDKFFEFKNQEFLKSNNYRFSLARHSLIPVIMMSGHGNIETAMKAAKSGAFDFIEKPFKSERLLLLIDKALNDRNLKIKVQDFETKENGRMELKMKGVQLNMKEIQLKMEGVQLKMQGLVELWGRK